MFPEGIIRPLLNRLTALERNQIRVRKGVVTAVNPLSVKLGGATTAYSNVKALDNTAFVANDLVSVVTFGNDMIVLGRIANGTAKSARGKVSSPAAFGGTRYATQAISHGLGSTPASAYVSNSIVAAVNTSSGQIEPVTSSITSVTSTVINVRYILPSGVTASVGPDPVWWRAEL